MLSFSERMQEARDIAARKRGQSIGRASYPARPLPERDSWDCLVVQVRAGLRSDFRNIVNDFRVACLNGTPFGDYDELAI